MQQRDRLDIRPFWRGFFGIFFFHSLLRRVHEDLEARQFATPTFSPGALGSIFVILVMLRRVSDRLSEKFPIMMIGALLPAYLCIVPVQSYVNQVAKLRNPNSPQHPWTKGQFIVLAIGAVIWLGMFLILIGAE